MEDRMYSFTPDQVHLAAQAGPPSEPSIPQMFIQCFCRALLPPTSSQEQLIVQVKEVQPTLIALFVDPMMVLLTCLGAAHIQ